nr:cupin domain-containing protein [Paracoccus nototheniae]
MSVVPADSETSQGPAERFTGSVAVGPAFEAPGDARLSGALVTFEPGARTAWHSHPLGQTLYVTQGCALVQSEGQDILTAGPGDIVQIPPEVRHWHGAASDQGMAHVAILESLNGVGTTWMDLVSDDQIPPGAGC